jgi:hypothetical protein
MNNSGTIKKAPNKKEINVGVTDLKPWNGEWTSFTECCKDEELNSAWALCGQAFGLNAEDLKDTFKTLGFIPDDIVNFQIKDNKITAFDSKGMKVFSHVYKPIKNYGEDSDGAVIDGAKSYLFKSEEKDAGPYTFLCLMKLCNMEQVSSNDSEMAKHFHFKYGETEDEIINSRRIVTMIDAHTSEKIKYQSILTFFKINSNCAPSKG